MDPSARRLSPAATTAAQTPAQLQGQAAGAAAAAYANPTPHVPYDEALLDDRDRNQWQFGDRASLAGMNCKEAQVMEMLRAASAPGKVASGQALLCA